MTRTYYHATSAENLESILDQGIRKGCDNVVYLCEKSEEAARFPAIRGINPIIVFGVNVEESMVEESFDHNERFFGCKAYTYPDDIDRDDIVEAFKYER